MGHLGDKIDIKSERIFRLSRTRAESFHMKTKGKRWRHSELLLLCARWKLIFFPSHRHGSMMMQMEAVVGVRWTLSFVPWSFQLWRLIFAIENYRFYVCVCGCFRRGRGNNGNNQLEWFLCKCYDALESCGRVKLKEVLRKHFIVSFKVNIKRDARYLFISNFQHQIQVHLINVSSCSEAR